jgi:hypothetical protein
MSQSCANVSNEVSLDLEKKIDSICKGASFYYNSLFKKMSSTNLRNAIILYEFLITEHNNQNIKLNTILTHTKILSLFNEYSHYKDFGKITQNDVMNYLNSLRKRVK